MDGDIESEYPAPPPKELALFRAVRAGRRSEVQRLLEMGADARATWVMDATPLHNAAQRGYVAIAKLLLRYGANIDACTAWNDFTPLGQAIEYKHPRMVRFLLEQGANPRNPGMGLPPRHEAARQGDIFSARLLLQHGACAQDQWKLGQSTALHEAAAHDQLAMAQFLVQQGAAPAASDSRGQTPLEKAEASQAMLTAAWLRQVCD